MRFSYLFSKVYDFKLFLPCIVEGINSTALLFGAITNTDGTAFYQKAVPFLHTALYVFVRDKYYLIRSFNYFLIYSSVFF